MGILERKSTTDSKQLEVNKTGYQLVVKKEGGGENPRVFPSV